VLHALTRLPALVVAIVAVVLPQRYWSRYPIWLPLATAGFLSGILTIFLGAAIGIPGFLEHAGATVSLANAAMLDPRNDAAGYNRGMVQGFSGLAIFTFLFLTPLGLLTLYLFVSGTVRAAAAWFEDPIGDPLLTGIDYALFAGAERHRTTRERTTREALEGPEVPDRIVSAASAGLPPCDLVVVASRRKPGWERGVTIFPGCRVSRRRSGRTDDRRTPAHALPAHHARRSRGDPEIGALRPAAEAGAVGVV
jgi:hypothetical protein